MNPIVIPWKFCAQANHRLMPVARRTKTGKISVRLITAAGYREAKVGAEYHIKAQWKGKPLTVPVELVARCYFPDKRKRDASNLAKMLGDAMSGIVFEDDSQIHRETYERSGIDRENPRVELTISALDADFTERKPSKRIKPTPVEAVNAIHRDGLRLKPLTDNSPSLGGRS